MLQVRIGQQGKFKDVSVPDGSIRELQVGKFVVVRPNLEWAKERLAEDPNVNLEAEPWVAQVVSEPNWETGEVEVVWYQAATAGKINGVWYMRLKHKAAKKGERDIADKQLIPLSSIDSFNYEMLKSKKFGKKILDRAKAVMSDLKKAVAEESSSEDDDQCDI